MSTWAVRTLRLIIAVALVGSVVVQAGMVALLWWDNDDAPTATQISLVVIGVLGVIALQVVGVCIWRLLTMVRSGTVFSHAAFRYVDLVIGAISVGALLVLAAAVVARFANHATPGDEVAPGLVGLICGLALVAAGVALVVYVMRTLLAQAVKLRSELDEVI
ncbi:DUF2975 domain-containing protein [Aeromicrobium chenweiae]|uniref:DUF2975 domain-containing protein n=1 Tax=Aeromicrobium chenweiae TaxID=2079793 RepID=A0A2S0WLF6_9ACTN|nr:DUF2975 domain-containing protein [Aeromicrobium chenweiae]AWB92104.1 DUF2975 domain-containing protein [Aeromicrobium chenweiae]TGN32953.1 DUF2975 domain-containing protein [Aeromicrobium chenweiae]